ncbi:hypothetical protein BGX34_009482 [Mortierella sp. NVP85]|nr:hypothetical protein BGX34_009482 [Mortierella sp. NVP85]
MDYYVNIFKDPPNVDQLLASVRPPPVSMEAFKPAKKLIVDKGFDLSDLEMGHDSTREKAFLAVLYLHHRLSLEEEKLRIWCRSEPYNRLETITREIRYVEPMLRGLTPNVLLKHHQCVIKHYRDLAEGLEAGVYPNWMPTYFSKIARDLSIIEDNIGLIQLTLQNKENNRLARKARKMENAKVMVCQMEQTGPGQMDQKLPGQTEPEQMEQMGPENMEQMGPEQMDQVQSEQMQQIEPEQIGLEQMEQATQAEQPYLLPKARIDNVMIAIAWAMAMNDHDVPIMVLALDRDGEPFMTEFVNEGEDKNEVPVSMQQVPADTIQPKGSGVRDFDHIFKDPPNVRELIARICHSPASAKASKHVAQSSTTRGRLNFEYLQMGDDSTRERAFVAALYLRNRLCQEDRDLWTWCTISSTKRLETIVKEISSVEPLLQCFNSDALIQHYQQVITLYRAMEKEMPGGCPYRRGDQSHFLKIARRLSIIETNTGLLQLSERTKQREEKKATEEKKVADKEFERKLQVHANSMNNKAEGLVDGVTDWHQALPAITEAKEARNDEQRWEEEKNSQPRKGKNKKGNEWTDKVLERILEIHMNSMNNKAEELVDAVTDLHQALPPMTEAKEARNDEQRWEEEKKRTDKVSKWLLDIQMKTFHEKGVMADRQRNDGHQTLPTMVRAVEKKHAQPRKGKTRRGNERTDKVLERILEIHMNTTNNNVERPVVYHQALSAVPRPWDSEDGLSSTSIGQFEHRGEFRLTQAMENDEEDKEDKEGGILTTVQPALTGDRMQSPHPVPGPNQYPGMEFFVDIFKDPLNVDELLASVRPPPTSFEAFSSTAFKRAEAFSAEKGVGLSDLRMGDDSTREKAFLSALYLKNRLSLEETELRIWCKRQPYNRLKTITKEIQYAEPALRGLASNVLLEHHQCVIKHWQALEEGLYAGAYPNWAPTHFSNIARDLSIIENNNGLIRLTLQHKEGKCLARKGTVPPRQLEKKRIDAVLVQIAFAMAENNHDVPIVAPLRGWEHGEHLMTDLKGKDKDDDEDNNGKTKEKEEIPIIAYPEPAENISKAFIKAKDDGPSDWMDRSHMTASPNEPSPTPAPGMMNRPRPTLQTLSSPQTPNPGQHPGMEYFVNIFKDPPNVDKLLVCIQHPPTSAQAHANGKKSMRKGGAKIDLMDLQMEGNTRETAFVAALYLRNRLSLREEELAIWCKSPLFNRVKGIVREIRIAEPKLSGLSVDGLVDYHRSLVELYRRLDEGLQARAYPEWVPTHFSNIARDLWIIENNTGFAQLRVMRQEENQRVARKEQQSAQAEQSRVQTRNDTTQPRAQPIDQPTAQPTAKPTVTPATTAKIWTRNDSLPVIVHKDAWHEGGFISTQAEGKDGNEEDESDEDDLDEDEDNDKADSVTTQPVPAEGGMDAPGPRPEMRFENELRDIQGIVAVLQATLISQNQEIALLKQELLMQRGQCEMSSSHLLAWMDPQKRQTSTLSEEGTPFHA